MEKYILVTGGAGYIGSNVILKLAKNNYKIVCLDNFSNSYPDAIYKITEKFSNVFIENVDLLKTKSLKKVFKKYDFETVIHLAGKKYIQESIEKTKLYYKHNVVATCRLLKLMKKFDVRKMIFASSITVYGNNPVQPLLEDFVKKPISPYACQKDLGEKLIEKWTKKYGDAIILRLSNPIGAETEFMLGNNGKNQDKSILPYIFENHDKILKFNGNTHPTKDGTTVRDYIHVEDVANAFIKAVNIQKQGFNIYNVGSGNEGYSVLDLLNAVEKVLNKNLEFTFGEKKKGDVSILIGDNSKAKKELGFKIEKSLLDMVQSQYDFKKRNE